MNKEVFFRQMDQLGLALTYDDVRLKSGGPSKVMPDEVSLESKFSKNVPLHIPLVSAAMDRVTESYMAIAMAMLGGLGVIHRQLSPEAQAKEVARVKFYVNGFIVKPICVRPEQTIHEILTMREQKRFPFHSFPVTDNENRIVGILSSRDFEFCDNTESLARNVMTAEVITAPEGTSIDEAYTIMMQHKSKLLPIVNKENRVVGLYSWKNVKDIKSGRSSKNNLDANGQLRVAAAIGTGGEAIVRARSLAEENVDAIVIDTAHADSEAVYTTIRLIKKQIPNVDLVVGNISEPDSAKRLLDEGVDGLKIGQGPGSICTTRIVAGIGCPQVTAIYNCSRIAESYSVPINADGGLRYSGDIPVAIGAGAHSVMMGSMFAGTNEAPGKIIYYKGRQWKQYRGMGSLSAMQESKSSRERYLQNSSGKDDLVPEGIEGLVPYKGSVDKVVFQYIGGLRRGMGYVGAADIEELRKTADFHRTTHAGQSESHPHDVLITEEAPNYPGGEV